jgi:hypothetical protein
MQLDGREHRRPASRARSGELGVGRTFQIAATFGSLTRARERADGAAVATLARRCASPWRRGAVRRPRR